jgi:hypothetical protein
MLEAGNADAAASGADGAIQRRLAIGSAFINVA